MASSSPPSDGFSLAALCPSLARLLRPLPRKEPFPSTPTRLLHHHLATGNAFGSGKSARHEARWWLLRWRHCEPLPDFFVSLFASVVWQWLDWSAHGGFPNSARFVDCLMSSSA
ncbi:hypothetical protein CRG98_014203 [Punica granatum]|uniref:Uncharacterized protein n=1 Tax=Punica granatum TaxID=22663 RepID=A0A2I0KA24_PUNGR|nr:hypothetical protein CRG98_014203 [Punica granatum]